MAFLRRPLPQVPPPSAPQRSASPGDWTRIENFRESDATRGE
jgi:hypothetical protein